MKLDFETYRDKVAGCWLGKNIGGTLGAPFECRRGVFDVSFYTQETNGNPLPNDDLDLQLVWLNALERYGRAVNATILGEYWLTYISPNWAEYGTGKNNLRQGLVPPLSGAFSNDFRNSCGAFIRSEIWACVAPGHPELAVQYAFEDASVDHSEEGIYGEIFCAAVQSAAFVESDKWKLIEIGLSYIPEGCGIARGIAAVVDAYRAGESWQAARQRVLTAVPGTFGVLFDAPETAARRGTPDNVVPIGERGYDAPSNVAIMVLGWLYGEDDFGNSLCIATNCGEDADCTAGSLGSTLGIILGAAKIPKKWSDPIGTTIKTICLNAPDWYTYFPPTNEALTERILRLVPGFLGPKLCDVLSGPGYVIEAREGDALKCTTQWINPWTGFNFREGLEGHAGRTRHEFALWRVELDYHGEPVAHEGVERAMTVTLHNNTGTQQWVTLKWHAPEGWEVRPQRELSVPLETHHGNTGRQEVQFVLVPHGPAQARYELLLEIGAQGRPSKGYIPVVLLGR